MPGAYFFVPKGICFLFSTLQNTVANVRIIMKGELIMRLIANILWIIFGGLLHSIAWFLIGLLLCVTVVGIPFGLQCFKMAGLQLMPFGKHVETNNMNGIGLIGNIIWIVVVGWELALANLASAAFFAITIVGLPFAIQSLKLAHLSLVPFGTEVTTEHIL